MTDDDEDDRGKFELATVRRFSWLIVGVIAVDCLEDLLGTVSESVGKLRCHMIGHVQWKNGNDAVLREIEALPEIK